MKWILHYIRVYIISDVQISRLNGINMKFLEYLADYMVSSNINNIQMQDILIFVGSSGQNWAYLSSLKLLITEDRIISPTYREKYLVFFIYELTLYPLVHEQSVNSSWSYDIGWWGSIKHSYMFIYKNHQKVYQEFKMSFGRSIDDFGNDACKFIHIYLDFWFFSN